MDEEKIKGWIEKSKELIIQEESRIAEIDNLISKIHIGDIGGMKRAEEKYILLGLQYLKKVHLCELDRKEGILNILEHGIVGVSVVKNR